MERAYRQSAVVGLEGRIELSAPELLPGTQVEAILIVQEPEETERARLVRAVIEGEEDVEAGRTRPAFEFFEEHAERYALPG